MTNVMFIIQGVIQLVELFIKLYPYGKDALKIVRELKEKGKDNETARREAVGKLIVKSKGTLEENPARTLVELAVGIVKKEDELNEEDYTEES